jgi:DNA topoisomerase IA
MLTRKFKDKKSIAENIQQQARFCKALFIWTDCDREGEHIGTEVKNQARLGNARIQVKRAKFSNTEKACVFYYTNSRPKMILIALQTCFESGT